MSVLTYLTQAAIRDAKETLEGELISRPALIKSDGTTLTYAADVKISGYDDPLRNVTVAMGNRDLVTADVGQGVTLSRTTCGTFQISGFSKKKPGTRTRIPVYLGTIAGTVPGQRGTPPSVGAAFLSGLTVHRLTIGEMGSLLYAPLGWGTLPLGSYALYRGSTYLGLNSQINEDSEPSGATAPTIQTFTASPESLTIGQSAALAWSVFGATSVSIDQGIGIVSATGSTSVTLAITRTYTLTATNAAGTVTAAVTVAVGGEAPIDLAYDFGSSP